VTSPPSSSSRPGNEDRAQAGDLLAQLHSLPEDSPRRKSLRDQLVGPTPTTEQGA